MRKTTNAQPQLTVSPESQSSKHSFVVFFSTLCYKDSLKIDT